MANIISKLKPGFIFIQDCEECPIMKNYTVRYLGGEGVIYRVNPNHSNGAEPVTFEEFERA